MGMLRCAALLPSLPFALLHACSHCHKTPFSQPPCWPPLRHAPSIISCSSSSVMFSPSSLATRLRFLKEILPVSSSSNRLQAGQGPGGGEGTVSWGQDRWMDGVCWALLKQVHVQQWVPASKVVCNLPHPACFIHLPASCCPLPHRKAFMISSRLSRSPILAVIICRGQGGRIAWAECPGEQHQKQETAGAHAKRQQPAPTCRLPNRQQP